MENHEATTGDIMEFLQGHMVMKEEFYSRMNRQKLEILDSIDEKLAALKGDLIVMMRNEDKKVMLVVQKLKEKKIFDDHDVEEFLNLLPFPQIVRPS